MNLACGQLFHLGQQAGQFGLGERVSLTLADQHRHIGHCGGLKQGLERDVDLERLPDSGDDLGGEQRMAAELEELVIDTHLFQPQCLRPNARDPLLKRRTRGDEGAFQLGPGRGGGRECSEIHLAVRG